MSRFLSLSGLVAACCLLAAPAPAAAARTVLFEGDSIYNHIAVTEAGSERCMLFGRQRNSPQTCLRTDAPDVPLFEYTAMLFASFLFQPAPQRVALIGLGGGYLPGVFRQHLPGVKLDVVEVDPLVAKLAADYFAFAPGGGIALHVTDGRQFLKKTGERYGHVWIDAFNSDYIPNHLTTREFLELVRSRLTPGGVVAQNCFSDNQLYVAQLATFRAVFPQVYVFKGERTWNAILIGTDTALSPEQLRREAQRRGGLIGPIDLRQQAGRLDPDPGGGTGPVLTDDYSPANLLVHRKR